MLITDTGVLVRTRVAEIREMGRATQGVTLIAWTKAPSCRPAAHRRKRCQRQCRRGRRSR
jgi:DNA gyrase/topoisomerase IV subunit A